MPNTVQIVRGVPAAVAVITINNLVEDAPRPCLPSETPQQALRKLVTDTWLGMDIRVIAWSDEDRCWCMWHG
jgi:hypothetical protein